MSIHNNNPWSGKNALITGASSGIGAATAIKMAQKGLTVILTARRADLLERLAAKIRSAGGSAVTFPADLTQEAERERLFGFVYNQFGRLDILVNNAGFGWYGWYTDMAWETARDMLRVNVEAVVHLVRLFLPGMQEQGSGHIINVGSLVSAIPSQGVGVYAGSKAFMDAFTTSLHRDLARTNVHASVIRPGPVKSEFFDAAEGLNNGGRVPAERFAITCEQVADSIWGLVVKPRRMIFVPGWLGLVPWVEQLFGWVMDRIGPVLLERQAKSQKLKS